MFSRLLSTLILQNAFDHHLRYNITFEVAYHWQNLPDQQERKLNHGRPRPLMKVRKQFLSKPGSAPSRALAAKSCLALLARGVSKLNPSDFIGWCAGRWESAFRNLLALWTFGGMHCILKEYGLRHVCSVYTLIMPSYVTILPWWSSLHSVDLYWKRK